jgi:hypothetical protein
LIFLVNLPGSIISLVKGKSYKNPLSRYSF